MQVGDLVFSKYHKQCGIIIFIDDEDPDCFGILYAGSCDWCFSYSEDLEAVCK